MALLTRAMTLSVLMTSFCQEASGLGSQHAQGFALTSSGQRQRIALARALLRDPAVSVLKKTASKVSHDFENTCSMTSFVHLSPTKIFIFINFPYHFSQKITLAIPIGRGLTVGWTYKCIGSKVQCLSLQSLGSRCQDGWKRCNFDDGNFEPNFM